MLRARSLLVLLALVLSACRQDTPTDDSGLGVLEDLSSASFSLVDQDSVAVDFPSDFEGKPVVLGFIYTFCPDICPATTANMKEIRRQLGNPPDVQFATVTFDPERDTPSVLKNYARVYGLEDTDWTFLTGTPDEISRLMERMRVRVERSDSTVNDDGSVFYFVNHTDQISLIDESERLRFSYGGSNTPPEIIVEDTNALR
ncbi:MAG: SCO family protein [Bacteroidota bacterium]